jgi:hypothetical protein
VGVAGSGALAESSPDWVSWAIEIEIEIEIERNCDFSTGRNSERGILP